MNKPILCLDFDGVLHSYTSGWKGTAVIPDPPVDGAIEFLYKAIFAFDVQIYSSRSHQDGGIEAMQDWIAKWEARYWQERPDDPRPRTSLLLNITFPTEKPSAMVTIDDRALTFTGEWPSLTSLLDFKPWNRREKLGPTGEYPLGKLAPEDEGEIKFAVGSDPAAHKVILDLGSPVAWLGMDPDHAEHLAATLISHARRARGMAPRGKVKSA